MEEVRQVIINRVKRQAKQDVILKERFNENGYNKYIFEGVKNKKEYWYEEMENDKRFWFIV